KRPSAEQRRVREPVAIVPRLSRNFSLGENVVSQPGRGLRTPVRHHQRSQPQSSGWLAHHASGYDESVFLAEQNYARLARYADYIKPCPYNNCAGPRFAQYIRNIQSTVFRDSTPEEVLDLHYKILGYEGEATLDKLPTAGMSSDYLARETRRAIAEV